jgi:Zn-dependent M28 family amino/carboxypeptidase
MRHLLVCAAALACSSPPAALIPVDPVFERTAAGGWEEPAGAPAPDPDVERHRATVEKILAASLAQDGGWRKLEHLTDRIGHRLSGSKSLEEAVAWAVKAMKDDGHEEVRAEPIKVPHWERGEESATLVSPRTAPIVMLGLGGSVGTPKKGLRAEVVVVSSKEELEQLGDAVKGKIVLFDVPMPKYDPKKGAGYGETVAYRTNGPVWAAKQGAVASLVRSVTATSLRSAHTGATRYDDAVAKIPAAAISVEDAALLHRLYDQGARPVVELEMGARLLADADSANVIAELRGRELPDEVVVIGGHLDSWDVGTGAHDDGAGCVIAMQALTVLRALELRPRRTIRVVLYTNEENGVRGARGYGAAHAKEKHVAAIESDSGAFAPWGFSAAENTSAERVAYAERLATLLAPVGATTIIARGSGVDIEVSLRESGALLLGLGVDGSTYFDYHHSHADTLDKVDPKWLAWDIAAMAAMAWLLAEDDKMPDPG